jgi:PKD repeat protein
VTPLELDGIAPGEHRITVWKEGYLENSRVVRVEAGERQSIELELTSSPGSLPQDATQAEPVEEKGGGVPTWLWIAAAGGAGAATYMLVRDTNEPPPEPTISIHPTSGLQEITSFTMNAQATDPDADPLTYTWDFGDGTSSDGPSVTKVYSRAGNFNVSVTVRDEKESASSSTTVNVASMSGTWTGNLEGRETTFFTWTLTQNGTTITGNYSDTVNGSGTVTGSVSAPNNITLINSIPELRPGFWRGTIAGTFNRVDGTVDWFAGGPRTFYLVRR